MRIEIGGCPAGETISMRNSFSTIAVPSAGVSLQTANHLPSLFSSRQPESAAAEISTPDWEGAARSGIPYSPAGFQLSGIELGGGFDFDQRLRGSLQLKADEAPPGHIGFDIDGFGEFPENGIRFDLRPDFECLAGQKFRSGDLTDQTAAGGADLSDFNRLPGGVDQSEGVLPAFRRRVGAEIGHAIPRHLQSARRQPAAEETSQNHLR